MRLPWSRTNAGDPRGGLQSEEYRHADPRELVEEHGTVMSGPGGAPQEGESVESRHRRNVAWRRKHWYRRGRRSERV